MIKNRDKKREIKTEV